jgi:hypothetical protein
MFSFGFQMAFQRGFEADDEVFFTKVREYFYSVVLSGAEVNVNSELMKSLESAQAVVTVLVDVLVPTGYIRFAPDGA